jgi:hypothetical protein
MHFEYEALMAYSSNILYILDTQQKVPYLHTADTYCICETKKQNVLRKDMRRLQCLLHII